MTMTVAQRILRARGLTGPDGRPLCLYRCQEGEFRAVEKGEAFVPELDPPQGDVRAALSAS